MPRDFKFATRYYLIPSDEYRTLKTRLPIPDVAPSSTYNPTENPTVRRAKAMKTEMLSDTLDPVVSDFNTVLQHAQKMERYFSNIWSIGGSSYPKQPSSTQSLPTAITPKPDTDRMRGLTTDDGDAETSDDELLAKVAKDRYTINRLVKNSKTTNKKTVNDLLDQLSDKGLYNETRGELKADTFSFSPTELSTLVFDAVGARNSKVASKTQDWNRFKQLLKEEDIVTAWLPIATEQTTPKCPGRKNTKPQ